jgi:hypothetical protein
MQRIILSVLSTATLAMGAVIPATAADNTAPFHHPKETNGGVDFDQLRRENRNKSSVN